MLKSIKQSSERGSRLGRAGVRVWWCKQQQSRKLRYRVMGNGARLLADQSCGRTMVTCQPLGTPFTVTQVFPVTPTN